MKVELIATARQNDEYRGTTKDKEYIIFKIRYSKMYPEGLVTYVNDNGELTSATSYAFTFKTR